jgi:hypothetical protein
MSETTAGRELVRVPPAPQTEYAPFAILWADELMAFERAMVLAAGYTLFTWPEHSRAFTELAEELHRRLLGNGPRVDPSVVLRRMLIDGLVEVPSSAEPEPPHPDSQPREPLQGELDTLATVEPEPTLFDPVSTDPTEQYGWPPARPSRMQRFLAWFAGGGS